MSDFSDIDYRPSSPTPSSAPAVDNAIPGTALRIKLHTENWNFEGEKQELDCGAFEIDTCDYQGPPDKMSIKAVSTPIMSSMRRQENTRNWNDATLEKIAGDIANDAGLVLVYEVEEEIQLDRVDQVQQSDMAFLQGLCDDYGVSLKATNDRLVLFDEALYEQKPVVDTFDKDEAPSRIIDYRFSQNTSDTCSKVKGSYKDPKSGLLAQADFEPPDPPATGQVALINLRHGDLRGDNYRNEIDTASEDPGGTFDTGFKQFNDITGDFQSIRADTTDAMKRQCRAVARKKNKGEWTCVLKMIGNVKMLGGVNIQLNNFGVYSGKYSVDEAMHRVGNGFTTEVRAHKVLKGY